MGCHCDAFLAIDMLTYGYPNALAGVQESEFYLGCRVVLHGLSKADLNGRAGTVEKTYNESNQRIGIRLDCVKGESNSNGKLVGIKPTNLRAEEEDSDLVIDQKILSGMFSAEFTQFESASSGVQTSYIMHLAREIHRLRQLAVKLKARVEASGKSACSKHHNDGLHALYRCDVLRLFNVQISLTRLLLHRARHVGEGMIPHNQGGLNCEAVDLLALAIEDEAEDTVIAVLAAESLLKEAAGALSDAQDLIGLFEELDERHQVGLFGETLPPGSLTLTEIYPMNDFCFGYMSESAASLSFIVHVPFLLVRDGISDGDNLNEHCLMAVKQHREWIEHIFFAVKKKVHPGDLTVQHICNSNPTVVRDVIKSLASLAMCYELCSDHGEIALRSQHECDDMFYFLGLAVAVARRSLGPSHEFFKRWGGRLHFWTYREDSTMDWRSNPLEDPPEALERILDAWLGGGSGGFQFLYKTITM